MLSMISVFVLTNTKWRDTVQILESLNLIHEVRHMKREPFTYEEFKVIMSMTADGFDDILTTRGKMNASLEEQGIHIEALPMREAYKLIVRHPSLLKLPIVTDFKTRAGTGVGGARIFRPRTEKKEAIVQLRIKADQLNGKASELARQTTRREVDSVVSQ